ncbi:MAG: hypothetical protein ACJ77H_15710, partial [Actinomycetota bacterium]
FCGAAIIQPSSFARFTDSRRPAPVGREAGEVEPQVEVQFYVNLKLSGWYKVPLTWSTTLV